MYRSTFSWPRHYLEVSGRLDAPATLLPKRNLPVAIGLEVGWIPELVWTTSIRIVPKLYHCRFLLQSFKFLIHYYQIIRYYKFWNFGSVALQTKKFWKKLRKFYAFRHRNCILCASEASCSGYFRSGTATENGAVIHALTFDMFVFFSTFSVIVLRAMEDVRIIINCDLKLLNGGKIRPVQNTVDLYFAPELDSWRCRNVSNRCKWKKNYNVFQWDAFQIYEYWDSLS
jgi:hypothetical protein